MYCIKKSITKLVYTKDDLDYHSSRTKIIKSFSTMGEALRELDNYKSSKEYTKNYVYITEYYVKIDNDVIIFSD